jgi:hypothetical protein
MNARRRTLAVAAEAALLGALLARVAGVDASPARKTPGTVSSSRVAPAVLPFIEDDWEKARHEARRLGIPIFIEAWAPW